MGFGSWFKTEKPKGPPSVDQNARGLAYGVAQWCSPKEMADYRALFHIPSWAQNFEEELFYVLAFLVLVGIRISYSDKPSFSVDLGGSFIRCVKDVIGKNTLEFHTSFATMAERHTQYFEVTDECGIDELGKTLTRRFLDHACWSDSRDDLTTVSTVYLYMHHWVDTMLIGILSSNKEWREQYRF